MSTMQRMTLIGMYNFDSDLFTNLSLPDGYDSDTFIETLLLDHGEKCVVYPDVDFMKYAIGSVSKKWELELTKIYDALTADYSPIYNYDRYEYYKDTDDVDRTVTDKPDYSNTQTNDYDIVTEQNTDGTMEHKVSAYNSSDYENSSKDIENNGKTTVSNDGTIKNEVTGTTQNVEDDTDRTFIHDAHVYGNIGIKTSTATVNEVVEQRQTKNLYEIAARIFANELTIPIY